MKSLFDKISGDCARNVTSSYSTSFSTAVKMLAPSIRQDIYNIYGFVRLADEIVDSFHDYDKENLFSRFEQDVDLAFANKISINPILNAFQHTAYKHSIPRELVNSFLKSMRTDLNKSIYDRAEYDEYIYGSADVVGLMCLKVFVKGDDKRYDALKSAAMRLGSGFQKVNFLRDLKDDNELLNRNYFPNTNIGQLDERSKLEIISEIEDDFRLGFDGILHLPIEAKFGVYTAYIYYRKLLSKLKATPSREIRNRRIRVPNYQKYGLFAKCYLNYKMNLL